MKDSEVRRGKELRGRRDGAIWQFTLDRDSVVGRVVNPGFGIRSRL